MRSADVEASSSGESDRRRHHDIQEETDQAAGRMPDGPPRRVDIEPAKSIAVPVNWMIAAGDHRGSARINPVTRLLDR